VLFLKAVAVGLMSACIAFFLITAAKSWQAYRTATRIGAVAGFVSVGAVLRTPWVAVVLILAFGLGLWGTLRTHH